ncbi:MAG: carboxypeptidase-like regulatory domain-containing protein [Nanoarchaeota archaeon]
MANLSRRQLLKGAAGIAATGIYNRSAAKIIGGAAAGGLEKLIERRSHAQQPQTEKKIFETDLLGNAINDAATPNGDATNFYFQNFGFIPEDVKYYRDNRDIIIARNPSDNSLWFKIFAGSQSLSDKILIPNSQNFGAFAPMTMQGRKSIAVYHIDRGTYYKHDANRGFEDAVSRLNDLTNAQELSQNEVAQYLFSSTQPLNVFSVDYGSEGTNGFGFSNNGLGRVDASNIRYKDIASGYVVNIRSYIELAVEKLKRNPSIGNINVNRVSFVRRNGLDRLVFFADKEIPMPSDFTVQLQGLMAEQPVNGVSVNVGSRTLISDQNGEAVFSNVPPGNYDVTLEGPITKEIINTNIAGSTTLPWKVLPSNFPSDLFRELYFYFMNNSLAKLRNPQDIDFQIFTGQSDRNRWYATPSQETIDKFVNMSKMLIRGGMEYFYDVQTPESQIRVINNSPRYGSGTFVIRLKDDILGGNLASRGPRVQGNEITFWIVDFRTNLETLLPQTILGSYLRELWGAIFGIVGEPILGRSNGLAERYDAYTDWVGRNNNHQLESFLSSKLPFGYYPGFGREAFSYLLELDRMMGIAANARPAGYTVRAGTNDFYVRLIN